MTSPSTPEPEPSTAPGRASAVALALGGVLVGALIGGLAVYGVMSRQDHAPPADARLSAAPPSDAAAPDARAPDAEPAAAPGAPDATAFDLGAPDLGAPDAFDLGAPDAARPSIRWPALPRRAAAVIPLRRVLPIDDGRWLYAARSEVTRAQWLRLAGQWPGLDRSDGDRPMVGLTAGQAAWFCNELSAREGLAPCYAPCDDPRRCATIPEHRRPCTGYRLPSRAEWQAIARRVDAEQARRRSLKLRPGAPVCAAVDGLDLCDLYGGVWEWTETARRFRGQPTAFRMGGSWDPGHRDAYREPIQHAMSNSQPFVGLRPVRADDDPRVTVGGLSYDPLTRQVARRDAREGYAVALEPGAAVLFERLVRNRGHLPAAEAGAAIRSGLGAALAGLGGRVGFEGAQVVLTPPE